MAAVNIETCVTVLILKASSAAGLKRVQNIFEDFINVFPMTDVMDLNDVTPMDNFIDNSKSFCF